MWRSVTCTCTRTCTCTCHVHVTCACACTCHVVVKGLLLVGRRTAASRPPGREMRVVAQSRCVIRSPHVCLCSTRQPRIRSVTSRRALVVHGSRRSCTPRRHTCPAHTRWRRSHSTVAASHTPVHYRGEMGATTAPAQWSFTAAMTDGVRRPLAGRGACTGNHRLPRHRSVVPTSQVSGR